MLPPLKDLCFFYSLLCIYGSDSLPTMSDLVRLLTYTYMLHRHAKGSAVDVGYGNPQLDTRIHKGSARQCKS